MIGSDVTWQAAANQPKCGNRNCRWGKIATMVIGVVFFIYTMAWFVLAHILQNRVLFEIEKAKVENGSFHCDDVDKTGYPLRVGVTCSNFGWHHEEYSIAVGVANLVADAPIYALSRRFIHLQAPAHLELAHTTMREGVSIDANWDALDIQADFDKGMVTKASLSAENLRLEQTAGRGDDMPFSGAEFIRLDVGKKGSQFLFNLLFDELAFNLKLEEEGEPLLGLSGDIYLIMDEGRTLPIPLKFEPEDEFGPQQQNSFARLLGQSGQVQRVVLRFSSGGELEGQGSFSFSQTGIISADFSVAIDDMIGLQRSLRSLLPSQASNLETLFFVLHTMPKNADGAPVLPIKIDEGNVRVGFLPIGKIPPILPTDETYNEENKFAPDPYQP